MLANNNVAFSKIPFGALLLIAMGGFFFFFWFLGMTKCCDLYKRGFEKYYQFLSHWFSGNGLFLLYRGFLGYQDGINGQFYILFSFASFSYYKFFNYRGHY